MNRCNMLKKYLKFILILASLFVATTANSEVYWVKKTGSDSNSCIGEANACLTINKGLSVASSAGDTLYIGAGTYVEDSTTSPYIVGGQGCGTLDGAISSLCMFHSGTSVNPITISAAVGQERQVIVDSQYARSGISLTKSDYIILKNIVFKNNWIGGIVNPGGAAPTTGAQLDSNLSIGCLIEGNVIDGVEAPDGVNASGIYFWSTKNWVIRNNYISIRAADDSFQPNGMQTYGTLNALIENNTIVDTDKGILFKDHYIMQRDPLIHSDEAIVRHNLIIARSYGMLWQIRGTDTNPAGNNTVNGNIVEIRSNKLASGISVGTGYFDNAGTFNIYNNIIYSATRQSGSAGISMSAGVAVSVNNNIVMGTDNALKFGYSSAVNYGGILVSADRNIYDSISTYMMDNNAATERKYTTLTNWKSANPADTNSLAFSSPDSFSITGGLADFKAKSVRFYKNYPNLVGGQKAGVYQTGLEKVGADFTYLPKPNSPQ